ncbi:feruloyl esterase B precursor [Fusarium mundagurra]|uniref:Carboxylic ester hydrolase n=1 Tax=Fusarium mundagurra TaxID=1567541 RepID=A0A8H5XUR7_9HYPO|nr:feruloyl esterase B precursor [Fusarium mundagurra]
MLSSFFLSLIGLGVIAQSAAAKSVRSCNDITPPNVPGATIRSVKSRIYRDHSVPALPPTLLQNVTRLDICEVNVTLSHWKENDTVLVQTWLPLNNWNSRYLAVGGGAWAAGLGQFDLALPASQGYAVSSTNAGLSGNPIDPSDWALKHDGTVNYGLLRNFASRSVHDMAVVSKAVIASFYLVPATKAYFNGCSTGGRQGLAAAQQYPSDFDGILAGAPAIYWSEYVMAELWPQVVMKDANYYPSTCELDAFVSAAVESCDGLDGVADGVVTDPFKCEYDPFTLVDQRIECGNESIGINNLAASVVSKIWRGPTDSRGNALWYGMPKGASLAALAATKTVNGTVTGAPFFVTDTWVRNFVKADPSFDTSQLNIASFEKLFSESKDRFGHIMDSSDPNLHQFEKAGGKMIIWHGLSDQLIYPQDSIRYFKEVQRNFNSKGKTEDLASFLRLFLAPGVDHCGFGHSAGAVPTDPFGTLLAWVEDEKPPHTLEAHTKPDALTQFSRKICLYPEVAKYKGRGNTSDFKNYICATA